MSDAEFYAAALAEAKAGMAEGGIPIGASMVVDGKVVAVGRNQRVQRGSAIHHGETNCIENAGRLPASVYAKATIYTTLSPCTMCAGTILLYKIPRVVIGENVNFEASEAWLRSNGVELVLLDDLETKTMFKNWIDANPTLWNEDIGVED
ncbi:MAG: nucleoside deaminase [Actinomycetales bacterium]|nr:nucleoside deaminase [Actinomycetales bacterium]